VVSGSPLELAHLMPPSLFHKENSVHHQIRFHSVAVHHFTSATLRRFHRRRLLHATDFSKLPGSPSMAGQVSSPLFTF